MAVKSAAEKSIIVAPARWPDANSSGVRTSSTTSPAGGAFSRAAASAGAISFAPGLAAAPLCWAVVLDDSLDPAATSGQRHGREQGEHRDAAAGPS